MIAYNKIGLRNLQTRKKAKQWHNRGLLSDEQFDKTQNQYSVNFYEPNFFIKIGLFLFTSVAICAALGMYVLMFSRAFDESGFIVFTCFFFAAMSTLFLELFIRNSRIHHSGTDEALLYSAIASIAIGIAYIFRNSLDEQNTLLSFCIIMMPVLIVAMLRYADVLVTLALSACSYTILFLLLSKIGPVSRLLLPFAFMALSIVFYWNAHRMKNKEQYFLWRNCIVAFECVGLLLFYLSGNYYIIRESSVAFFHMHLAKGQDIPLAFVFYLFTAAVPLLYVFFALKKKDKILLWIGLILIAAAVLTFKYYFSLGHPEITLTVAGIIMILVAYAAIRFLKTPKYGISFEEEPNEGNFIKTNAEAVLAAQTFSHTHPENPGQAEGFGGGSSGGAGAGGSF